MQQTSFPENIFMLKFDNSRTLSFSANTLSAKSTTHVVECIERLMKPEVALRYRSFFQLISRTWLKFHVFNGVLIERRPRHDHAIIGQGHSSALLRAAVSITLEQQDKDEALGRPACTAVQIRE